MCPVSFTKVYGQSNRQRVLRPTARATPEQASLRSAILLSSLSSLSSLLLRLASLGVLLCCFVCFSHRSHRAHRAHNAHRAHCPRRPPRKAHRAHCPRPPPRKSHVPPSEAKSSLPHRTDGVFTARRRGRSPGQGEHELRYGTLFSDALKKRIVCRMIFWGLG